MIQRFFILIFGCLFYTNLQAQLPKIEWDYGLNAQFNVNFIKPTVSDTLSNRPGVGGGLMIEASMLDKYALQFSPNFSKTAYIHDNTLIINTMSSIDMALDFVYTATKDESVLLSLGVIRAFNLSNHQKMLNGSSSGGLGSAGKLDFNAQDFGVKYGIGVKLDDGVRMNLNYLDFVDGTQRKGVLKGRVDYFQFGVQIRFNELTGSPKIKEKETEEITQVEEAETHQQLISEKATMVFVLPELKSAGIKTNTEQWHAEHKQILFNITKAIYTRYKIGDFIVIQPDQMPNLLKLGYANTIDSAGVKYTQTIESPFYVAKIGEFFLDNNSSLKWGILLFDQEMEVLQQPFNAFIPYRNIDTFFKNEDSVKVMISELNSSLR